MATKAFHPYSYPAGRLLPSKVVVSSQLVDSLSPEPPGFARGKVLAPSHVGKDVSKGAFQGSLVHFASESMEQVVVEYVQHSALSCLSRHGGLVPFM